MNNQEIKREALEMEELDRVNGGEMGFFEMLAKLYLAATQHK